MHALKGTLKRPVLWQLWPSKQAKAICVRLFEKYCNNGWNENAVSCHTKWRVLFCTLLFFSCCFFPCHSSVSGDFYLTVTDLEVKLPVCVCERSFLYYHVFSSTFVFISSVRQQHFEDTCLQTINFFTPCVCPQHIRVINSFMFQCIILNIFWCVCQVYKSL